MRMQALLPPLLSLLLPIFTAPFLLTTSITSPDHEHDIKFSFPTSTPAATRLATARKFAELNSLSSGFGCVDDYDCVAEHILSGASPIVLQTSITMPARVLPREHGKENVAVFGGETHSQETHIGKGSYFGGKHHILQLGEGASVTIGNYCSLGEEVTFYTGGDHNINHVSSYPSEL